MYITCTVGELCPYPICYVVFVVVLQMYPLYDCMYVSPLMHHSVILLLAQYKSTALHLAAHRGHLNMVKFLVPRFGVRVYEKNFFRLTCRDVAILEDHHHVVEYLDSDFPALKAKVSVAILHAGIEWISVCLTWLGT